MLANDLQRFEVSEAIVAGGGTRNPTLMAELRSRLPGVAVEEIERYGVASTAKEALVFAVIGFLTVHGLPGVVASCTGARHATVLGSVVPGVEPLALALAPLAPTRIIVRTPLAR